MGLQGTGGSRVEVPPGAASDPSCQHSEAEGRPPTGWAVVLGSGELFSQPPEGLGQSRGVPCPAHLGQEAAGLGERGRCQGGVPASGEKVPGGRAGPGRWRCFGGGALRGRVALTWVMRRSAPVFSSSLKMMSGL